MTSENLQSLADILGCYIAQVKSDTDGKYYWHAFQRKPAAINYFYGISDTVSDGYNICYNDSGTEAISSLNSKYTTKLPIEGEETFDTTIYHPDSLSYTLMTMQEVINKEAAAAATEEEASTEEDITVDDTSEEPSETTDTDEEDDITIEDDTVSEESTEEETTDTVSDDDDDDTEPEDTDDGVTVDEDDIG